MKSESEMFNALPAMNFSIYWAMQVDMTMLPPDCDPGASFVWFVLGLALLDFLIFAVGFHLLALAEEKRIKESLRENCENENLPDAASGELGPNGGKLGACRNEIWITDDFDAPLPG